MQSCLFLMETASVPGIPKDFWKVPCDSSHEAGDAVTFPLSTLHLQCTPVEIETGLGLHFGHRIHILRSFFTLQQGTIG